MFNNTRLKSTTLAALCIALSACGSSSSSSSDNTASLDDAGEFNARYFVTVYNTVGRCVTEGSEAVLEVENGVLVRSNYGRSPISGTVSDGGNVEGFLDFNGDTITLSGKIESTLTGEWEAAIGDCAGFFEENNREATTDL